MARRSFAAASAFYVTRSAALMMVSAATVAAQAPSSAGADTARARMAPLRWLVGEWEGPATVTNGGRTFTLTQRESVQEAANGTVLLMQGRGSMTLPNGTERNVFQAAGLLTYEIEPRKFTWISSGGTGHLGTTEAVVTGTGYVWNLVRPTGTRTRYTISRSESDEWREIGEESTDGTRWTKTFEMTLTRKQ
jgi:hypothetical protein